MIESEDKAEIFLWKEFLNFKIPYIYIPNCIQKETVDKLDSLKIDYNSNPVPLYKSHYQQVNDGHKKQQDATASNNSVTYYNKELLWLDQSLEKLIADTNSNKWNFAPLTRLDPYEFVTFNQGGYIAEHNDGVKSKDDKKDNDSKFQNGRLLTQVIHMSERGKDYTGGQLEIQNAFGFWLKVPLKAKGDVVYFPSILPHRVTTIETGRRITLTTFLSGQYPF
mgnify:CR=1 FL=1